MSPEDALAVLQEWIGGEVDVELRGLADESLVAAFDGRLLRMDDVADEDEALYGAFIVSRHPGAGPDGPDDASFIIAADDFQGAELEAGRLVIYTHSHRVSDHGMRPRGRRRLRAIPGQHNTRGQPQTMGRWRGRILVVERQWQTATTPRADS
jgi:hypothetical protein